MNEIIERYGTFIIYVQWCSTILLSTLLLINWDVPGMRSDFLLPTVVSIGLTASSFMVPRVLAGTASSVLNTIARMAGPMPGPGPVPLHLIPKDEEPK
jgi:hypothetical protein